MVDCGIMDTDPFPYPAITREELEAVDCLFLTHCHKDHFGAFAYFVEQGFCVQLVTSAMTCRLAGIDYENTVFLDMELLDRKAENGAGTVLRREKTGAAVLKLRYGRSGHCPGSLWFYMADELGSVFFSGDYQADAAFYACDRVQGIYADLAVADCAHNGTELGAETLRQEIKDQIRTCLEQGRPVILPVPKYGRGMELLYLLKKEFPDRVIRIDRDFAVYAERMLTENCWYRKAALTEALEQKFFDRPEGENFDVLLIADTHLQKTENQAYVEAAVGDGAVMLVTGRIRSKSLPERLLQEGRARRLLFPHHQSRGDPERLLADNRFGMVLPFHNEEQVVLVSGSFA